MRVNSLITGLQLKKMSVMYEINHFPITRKEFYHNTQPNNFEYSLKVHFSKGFQNIGDFTDLPNEKTQSGSFVQTVWFWLLGLL